MFARATNAGSSSARSPYGHKLPAGGRDRIGQQLHRSIPAAYVTRSAIGGELSSEGRPVVPSAVLDAVVEQGCRKAAESARWLEGQPLHND
ncbi:hypothetical protein J1614_003147 [Plenodomus biglobosus]|nr:hypothetical protein J1614_003147 [Plenodomus biglobosus]